MSTHRAPGVAYCMLLLVATDVALRTFGYARTLRLARRLSPRPTVEPSAQLIDQTLHQILKATAFYPGRSLCLEQSIVGYVLLRRAGLAVDLRLGVQPYPFSAHAWVELNGVPITESPEAVAGYSLLPDVAV
jgi:hypothetical protein